MRNLILFITFTTGCGLARPADVPDPIHITVESGDGQHTIVDHMLTQPLVVFVSNSTGPVENFTVDFKAVTDGVMLSESSPRTDILGHARTTLKLGTASGAYVVEARAAGTDSVATFTNVADPGQATKIEFDTPPATATAGSTLEIAAIAKDAFGNRVSGVAVAYAATGGGSLSAASVATDDMGRAPTRLTMATTIVTTHVEATVPTLAPVSIDIANVPDVAAQLAIVSGNNQADFPTTKLAPMIVRVRDQYGNIAPGVDVAFTVTASGGTLSETLPSNAVGEAQSTLTLPVTTADASVEVSVPNVAPVTFNAHALSFAGKVDSSVSLTAVTLIKSGDINGDGKPDLIVGSANNGTWYVFLNTTAANATMPTFSPPFRFSGVLGVTGMAIADFNGDGKIDVALGDVISEIKVFNNTTMTGATTPTFSSPLTLASITNFTNFLRVVDFNNDGKADLFLSSTFSSGAAILVNTTADPATVNFSGIAVLEGTSLYGTSADIGDINVDGKLDVIDLKTGATPSVAIRINTTTGATTTFAARVDLPVTAGTTQVILADMTGDGKPDVVTSNTTTNIVSIRPNTTAANSTMPTFGTPVDFMTGTNPTSVRIFDINKDGKLDMLTANKGSATVSLFFNASTSAILTLAPKIDLPCATNTSDAVIADINGDTHFDVISGNQGSFSTLLAR